MRCDGKATTTSTELGHEMDGAILLLCFKHPSSRAERTVPLSPSPPSHCLAPLVSPLSSLLKVCPLPLLASSAVPVSLAVSRGGGGKSPGESKDGRAQDKLCVQTPLCPRLPPATKKHQEAKKQTWHSGQTWMRQKRDKIRLAGPQPGAPACWPGPGWGPRLSSPAL